MFCRRKKKYQKDFTTEKKFVDDPQAISWKPVVDDVVHWPSDGASQARQPTKYAEEYTVATLSQTEAPKIQNSYITEINGAPEVIEYVDVPAPPVEVPTVVVETSPNGPGDEKLDVIRDDNDNHIIEVLSGPKTSIAPSLDSRFSAASVRSNGSEASHRVTATIKALLKRRRAFHEDDDTEVQLGIYHKSSKEEEAILKAFETNGWLMEVISDAQILRKLIPHMCPIEIKRGDIIMRQGDEGDSMYVSKAGEFEVSINGCSVTKFHNCRLFGEVAILYNTTRTATISALSNGMLWQLKRKDYRAIAKEYNINEEAAILDFLRKVPTISAASDRKLKRIAKLCSKRYYAKDTAIVREGEPGNDFYIIQTGTATVTKKGKGRIKQLERGDYFGERALLNEDKRMATVSAGDYGVNCLILSRADFSAYLFSDLGSYLAADDDDTDEDELPLVAESEDERKARYADIELSGLKTVRMLGQGGFGTVNLVKASKGRCFALKAMEKKLVRETNRRANVFLERDLQKACADCPFIVQLHRTFEDATRYYYLLEFCPRGELFKLLRKKRFFGEDVARFTSACILEGLLYLHRMRVAYLDLKPENVFIDIAGYPKLGDFGTAIQVQKGNKLYAFCGTIEYMAPEIFQNVGYDLGADYWAFGVLLFEMLVGRTPFLAKNEEHIIKNISKGSFQFPSGFNKVPKDLIKGLLQVNQSKRLGSMRGGGNELRKNEWFRDIDWRKLRSKEIRSPLLGMYKK